MYRSCAFIKVSTPSNRWKFRVFKVLRISLVSVLIKYKNFNVTSILRDGVSGGSGSGFLLPL